MLERSITLERYLNIYVLTTSHSFFITLVFPLNHTPLIQSLPTKYLVVACRWCLSGPVSVDQSFLAFETPPVLSASGNR